MCVRVCVCVCVNVFVINNYYGFRVKRTSETCVTKKLVVSRR